MTPNEIDQLTGRELDAAVAVELGWKWLLCNDESRVVFALYPPDMIARFPVLILRPEAKDVLEDFRAESWDMGIPYYSTNLADAWELDGEGWEFDEMEWRDTLDVMLFYNQRKGNHIEARVKFYDFPTKAAAYATARCRCWLKARQAEAEALKELEGLL